MHRASARLSALAVRQMGTDAGEQLDTTIDLGDILLRPWRDTDADALVEACQDPEIARWVSIPVPFTHADAVAFIEEARSMWRAGTGAPFAIVEPGTDALLGAVTRFGPDGHQANLGCWVARDARGRGIGTRVLREVARWTFLTTGTIRLDTYVMVGNTASESMNVRAGFRREGVLRSWDLLRGEPVDCVVYSMLRSEQPSG